MWQPCTVVPFLLVQCAFVQQCFLVDLYSMGQSVPMALVYQTNCLSSCKLHLQRSTGVSEHQWRVLAYPRQLQRLDAKACLIYARQHNEQEGQEAAASHDAGQAKAEPLDDIPAQGSTQVSISAFAALLLAATQDQLACLLMHCLL